MKRSWPANTNIYKLPKKATTSEALKYLSVTGVSPWVSSELLYMKVIVILPMLSQRILVKVATSIRCRYYPLIMRKII